MANPRGSVRRQRRPVRIGTDHRRQRLRHRLAAEWPLPSQHLVQDHAKRPDVGALVEGLAAGLLRRHVCRGAENDPGLGGRHGQGRRIGNITRRGALPQRLSEAEVEYLHLAVMRQLDVCRLQVAVNDAVLVGVFEGFRDLLCDG